MNAKERFERAKTWTADRGRRSWAAIRRHPWWTAAALPLAALLYVVALLPFTPSIVDIKKSKQESPTVVLSADGKELAVFKRANRDWVKLEDISPNVKKALLATEDHRFYDHIGIDFKRTAKAVINTLQGDREGGSTLTQQLARNLYPEEIGRAPTITRKIKEAITALKIEAVYSKDEILETYLNSVSFLYNAWGIEMAARTYFDKPAKELNELQAATLVGMLKGTSYYNPVLNPERAVERRNTVLAQLVKHGELAQDRYATLKAQPLKLDFERIPEFNGPAPHLAEHLRRWLLEWADKNDYNIYADGLVVRTTIDSRLQAMANEAVQRQGEAMQAVADVEWSKSGKVSYGTDPKAWIAPAAKVQPFEYFWNTHKDLLQASIRDSVEYRAAREQGVEDAQAIAQLREDEKFMARLRRQKTTLQAGFLALEPQTGHVRAWVGSRDYNEDKFDHVQQARRQPGSTFKPFVYGAAFEMGIPPNDTLVDGPVEIQIDRNQVWRPGDVGDGPTNAPMTLRDGLARSKNSITAQLMMRVGPSRVASLARSMGVRQSPLHEVPSLALGTSPVTLKEMVTAFGSIANGGSYIEPVLVTSIDDREGNTLDRFHAAASEAALSNQAAQTLLDTLRGVIEQGTAVGLKHRFGLTGDLAGKTGTTQDNTDGWFILMHPQLVAGAWMGFNDNRVTMRSEYWGQGAHNALLVVGDFFQQATRDKVIDAKATFSAPRLREQEQPLMDRMNDWWASVFSSSPSTDTAVVTTPPPPTPSFEPPVLVEPPRTVTVGTDPLPMARADAPVVVEPQRVPEYPAPRSYDSGRPVETVPGTQVYRVPEARTADSSSTATPAGPAVLVPRPLQQAAPAPRPGTGQNVITIAPSGPPPSASSTPAVVAPASPTTSMGASSSDSAPAAATGSTGSTGSSSSGSAASSSNYGTSSGSASSSGPVPSADPIPMTSASPPGAATGSISATE